MILDGAFSKEAILLMMCDGRYYLNLAEDILNGIELPFLLFRLSANNCDRLWFLYLFLFEGWHDDNSFLLLEVGVDARQ
jgi:hypothetical protein